MSAYKALLAYESLLRHFQHELASSSLDIEGTIENGVGTLMTRLKLENVGLFWWDPQRKVFSMQYVLFEGTLMEGEEEIAVDLQSPHSPLRALVEDCQPVVVSEKKPWVAFIPLRAGPELIGAIRF